MKFWWILFLLDLTVTIFAIKFLIKLDVIMTLIFTILAIIISIIFKGYDGYKNTGVWFG